jgi:hypothetical protein
MFQSKKTNMKKISLDEMWKIFEGYGIKREILEKSHPTEDEVLHLYQMIRKRRHDVREREFIRILQEHAEKLNILDRSYKSAKPANVKQPDKTT